MHVICRIPCGMVTFESISSIKERNKQLLLFFIVIFWVLMFIIMHMTNYMRFFSFFPKIHNVIIYNTFNEKMLDK
jgi:hypothetical protein